MRNTNNINWFLLRFVSFFQRQAKYSENKLKCTKARNDYLLNLAATNAVVAKYYIHDVSDMIDVSMHNEAWVCLCVYQLGFKQFYWWGLCSICFSLHCGWIVCLLIWFVLFLFSKCLFCNILIELDLCTDFIPHSLVFVFLLKY